MSNSFSQFVRNPRFLLLIRLVLGGIFVTAFLGKVSDPEALVNLVASYQILPGLLAQTFGNLLPWLELAIGSLLILGIFSRIAAAIQGDCI
jgi:uncharacterized membrane protein YphA (DoxX/SURF4 family)